jgi:hypothetical protein
MSRTIKQVATLSSLRDGDRRPREAAVRPRAIARNRDAADEETAFEDGDRRPPLRELLERRIGRRENRVAAREKMADDRERYSEEELEELRDLYRGEEGEWDTPERRERLEELVEKYPEASMTGCALVQLAHDAPPGEAAGYLKQAIDDHSDSYCFAGLPVGAIARDQLAEHFEQTGQPAKAKHLRMEIKRDYPGAMKPSGKKQR